MTIKHFEPHGRFEAAMATLLRKTLQWLLKPIFHPRFSIAFQRRWLKGMSRLTMPPRGVLIEPGQAGGVPGEWLLPRDSGSPARGADASGAHGRSASEGTVRGGTVLYLHGGAYCVGSPATHRAITGRLARLTGMAVFSLDYRLAPEHRFPAAIDDAVAACRELQARGAVVIAGDSAGGGLALATALALRDGGHALPAALWLLSPWADMALPATPPPPVPGEAMLSFGWASACAAFCLGDTAASHPLASPLHADLRGLPAVLLQAGTDEMLHDQAIALHDALQQAGVAVRCEVTARRWHVFQMNAGALPSADAALQRAADFIGGQVDAASAASPAVLQHEVLVMGAGMSGLCMAVQLKRAGRHDFVILEKSPGLGGTWWDNRYPGAHVDVPSPLYSFSFAPNPRWRRRFAASSEIQAYMLGVARRFGVLPHVRFGQQVKSAVFDEPSGRWTITTGGGQVHSARFFVCSTGPLNQPRLPDIAGLSGFQGRVLHSARWDASVDLAGQRVAVIGTGSTASQLVAPIAAKAGQLHVFQRTANWVLPRIDRRYIAFDRWLAHLPPYTAVVRAFWYHVLEWGRRGFDEGTVARRAMLKTAALHRARQVGDAALRERLTPNHPLGCKRIIYSNDFYPAFSRPNVELVTTPIERFTAHGIVTADGRERPIDTLVCATGFDTVHLLGAVDIVGRDGRHLKDAWRDGPEAWHGLVVAGFPNFFLMLGPNTATGHTSTLLFIEPGVRYAVACMQHLRASGARWLDLRAEVMTEHNRMLQARLAGSVWTQCRSWYRSDSGKVVALWPGFTAEYQRAIAQPDFRQFTRA
jgi:cation diffusion facilitator CzcD-associated flavoprotein CzcO/acetyl esterase/lipase